MPQESHELTHPMMSVLVPGIGEAMFMAAREAIVASLVIMAAHML